MQLHSQLNSTGRILFTMAMQLPKQFEVRIKMASTFLYHNEITQNMFQMKEETKIHQFLDCFEVRERKKTG